MLVIKASFPHRKLRCLAVAKSVLRNEETPTSLYSWSFTISHSFRDKRLCVIRYLDWLSSRKNRLEKVQCTVKRKTTSWEIFPVYLSEVRKSPGKSFSQMQTPNRSELLSKVPKLWNPFEIFRFGVRDRYRSAAGQYLRESALVAKYMYFFLWII